MVRATGAAACPFCGSDEVCVEEYEHHPGAMRWRVLCAGCMAGVDTGTRQSAGDAVPDWNRRAERTCRNLDVRGDRGFECSACGYEAETYGDSLCNPDDFEFCPMCGARVIEEEL